MKRSILLTSALIATTLSGAALADDMGGMKMDNMDGMAMPKTMFRLARFTPIEQVDRLAAAFATRKPAPVAVPCYDFGAGCRNVVVYKRRFGRLCRQDMVWALVPGHMIRQDSQAHLQH